jgi:hypothetical protein
VSLPDPLKRELAEVDATLEIVVGQLMAISGRAKRAGLPKVALHVTRKKGAIGHARQALREDTQRIAAEEAPR